MAAVTKDLRRLRRIGLTLHVMTVLENRHLWLLTSGNERERLLALAAVGTSTTRPLLGAAIMLRGNRQAVRELRRAFPQHRRVIERASAMSQDLALQLPG